jgi:hypothetical protein
MHQKFIFHSSGSWEVQVQVLAQLGAGVGCLLDSRLLSSHLYIHRVESKRALWVLCITELISFVKAPDIFFHLSNYLPPVI